MAEKAACEQLENERLAELNEAAQGVSYGDVHKGVSIRINRMASVNEDVVAQYKSVAPPLSCNFEAASKEPHAAAARSQARRQADRPYDGPQA